MTPLDSLRVLAEASCRCCGPSAAGPDDGLVTEPAARLLVILLSYLVTLAFSGYIVRYFVGSPPPVAKKPPAGYAGPPKPADLPPPRFDTGMIIGKCENILTMTLILMRQEAGLAIIFAAKSIVRKDEISANANYYLGGTMVNLVWSMLIAVATRLLVFGH